jgi:hypothetical protein
VLPLLNPFSIRGRVPFRAVGKGKPRQFGRFSSNSILLYGLGPRAAASSARGFCRCWPGLLALLVDYIYAQTRKNLMSPANIFFEVRDLLRQSRMALTHAGRHIDRYR